MHKGRLKWWVQRVLPLVYDDSLSYYELLAKVIDKVNELIAIVDDIELDIKKEVTEIMNQWLEDGTLEDVIQAALQDLDARIIAVDNRVTAEANKIVTLENKVKWIDTRTLRGQTCVFFGDSWCVGGSAGSVENRFSTQICNILGMTERNFGVGGAGFTRSNSIINEVTTATNQMTASERANVPLVILVGGVNDLNAMGDTTFSEFLTACSACIDAIHTAFPNALIVAGISNTRVSGLTLEQYNWITGAQERIVYHKNFPVLVLKNVYNYVRGRTQWYVEDGLHLSTIGHGVFANNIVNAICGGSTHQFDFIGYVNLDNTKIRIAQDMPDAPRVYKNDDLIIITGFHWEVVDENITENTQVGSIPETCGVPTGNNQYFPISTNNALIGTLGIYHNVLFMKPNVSGTAMSGGFVPDIVYLSR